MEGWDEQSSFDYPRPHFSPGLSSAHLAQRNVQPHDQRERRVRAQEPDEKAVMRHGPRSNAPRPLRPLEERGLGSVQVKESWSSQCRRSSIRLSVDQAGIYRSRGVQ